MSKCTAISEDKKWRAESDLRTLVEANEIKKDRKRFEAAQKLASEKSLEMGGIASASNNGGK